MNDYLQQPVIRDPEMRRLVSKKNEALESYLDCVENYGEQDSRTQMKLVLYVLRSYLSIIREQVQGLTDILIDFNAISTEIDSLFDIELGSSQRFLQGLERFPLFLQRWIANRRARKYYAAKFNNVKVMLNTTKLQIDILPMFMQSFGSAISSMCEGIGKSINFDSKKGGIRLTDELQREIEARKKARGIGGEDKEPDSGKPSDEQKPSGNEQKPSGGGKKPGSGSDKWDD